jgi:hypothetical protein
MGLLVIFGAGASYDSINPVTFVENPNRRIPMTPYYRPPLAVQLFEDRPNFHSALSSYPYFNGRVSELRRKTISAGGLNVERELEQIQQEVNQYPPAAVELAAIRFYLRQILWDCGTKWHARAAGATNYAELLRRIEQWWLPRKEHVVLVTFNYDLLLDAALASFPIGLKPSDIDDYVRRDDYKVIKPHGSVNWSRIVEQPPPHGESEPEVTTTMIARVADLRITDSYVINDLSAMNARNMLFPAVAIPVESKSDFACPQSHITAFVQSLTGWRGRRNQSDDTRHVLIIGWRASEGHFLEIVRGHLSKKRVLVIAESQAAAEQTAQNLSKADVERGDIHCSDKAGFSEFLAVQELESFLQAD